MKELIDLKELSSWRSLASIAYSCLRRLLHRQRLNNTHRQDTPASAAQTKQLTLAMKFSASLTRKMP